MPISSKFSSILSVDWEINFSQCAPNGFLKYTELCNLLQLTAASHSVLGGISFDDMQEFHQAWVLSRMRIEITELPVNGSTITIKTWINNLENSRSVRALEVFLGEKKIVGCETYWAVFNTQSRRPEALALPFEHFELFPDKKATKTSFSKINLPDDLETLSQKTVRLSDLDIVKHVNNVKYLEWCLDYLNPKLILKQELSGFEMNFMKELSLKDEVEIKASSSSNPDFFAILKNNKPCFALQLNWKNKD